MLRVIRGFGFFAGPNRRRITIKSNHEPHEPHEKTLGRSNRLRTIIAWSILSIICFSSLSCQQAPNKGDKELARDAAATAEINRINATLTANRPVSAIDIDSLNKLRGEYPASTNVRRLLQGVYIKRSDWAAAEKVISETPESERTNADRINLAKIFFRQGKFVDAIDFAKKVSPTAEERVEVAAIIGQSQFYTGSLDDAAITLESVRNELVGQSRADELTILGTIYFRRGDNPKAIDVLRQAVAVSPENIGANNALSRVYAAAGDQANAELYRQKLQTINDRIAAEEKKRTRLIPLYYQLEDAYKARDFDKVIAIVKQIQPEADSATKQTLFQYLITAYEAQGKQSEAQAARNEAAKLTTK